MYDETIYKLSLAMEDVTERVGHYAAYEAYIMKSYPQIHEHVMRELEETRKQEEEAL